MKQPFPVHNTPHYERLVRKLLNTHPELDPIQERVREILSADPYNGAGLTRSKSSKVSRKAKVNTDYGSAGGVSATIFMAGKFGFFTAAYEERRPTADSFGKTQRCISHLLTSRSDRNGLPGCGPSRSRSHCGSHA